MIKEKVFCSMEHIDSDLIDEAENYKGAKKTWVKWGVLAACLCLVVVGILVLSNISKGAKDIPEKVRYNDAEYVICGSGEAAILEECGLPTTITQSLAGEFLGNLSPNEEGDIYYVSDDSEESSLKIYEYASEPNRNVYILCKDGEYYAAIRRDNNGYYGLMRASE